MLKENSAGFWADFSEGFSAGFSTGFSAGFSGARLKEKLVTMASFLLSTGFSTFFSASGFFSGSGFFSSGFGVRKVKPIAGASDAGEEANEKLGPVEPVEPAATKPVSPPVLRLKVNVEPLGFGSEDCWGFSSDCSFSSELDSRSLEWISLLSSSFLGFGVNVIGGTVGSPKVSGSATVVKFIFTATGAVNAAVANCVLSPESISGK